jgi:heat shock protein HslJ
MTKSIMKLMAVFASMLLVAACQPVRAPAGANLAGTRWVLSSLNSALPLSGILVTLQFGTDGSASGSDGCNDYSTTYTVNGSNIRFGTPIASTMMACPEPVMNQATAYTQMLGAANTYEVASNHLNLRDGRQVIATFVAESQALGGTAWQVIAYNNGRDAVVSVIIGTEITAEFGTDGEIAGNAGCNDYFASYQTDGESIAFGPVGATQRTCAAPPGVMEQEGEYLAALQSAATYQVEGNTMQLRMADGATAVQLSRKAAIELPAPAPDVPTGRVTAPGGVNVRSGPGTNYPVIGFAPFGAEGEIVGRSADGRWWAAAVPSAPGGIGWVSADYVATTNTTDVPVLQPAPPVYVPPPAAAPAATPTPVPPPTVTPSPTIAFWADQTTIDQGQCTNLNWSVENVQAVWVYPQGEPYEGYPRTGQGSEQVCPSSTTTYEMLVLLRNGQTVVQSVTIEVVPAPQDPLAGTSWEVVSYNNGQEAVVSVIVDTRITANFGQDGQVTGNAGCNDYFGPYQTDGSAISIGPVGMSAMACAEPEGVMQQENEYLAALQSATTYRIDGNRLELRSASGAIAVTFIR